MAPIILDGVCRVAAFGQCAGGQPWVSVFHVGVDGAASPESAATSVRDAYQDHLLDAMSNSLTFGGVQFMDLSVSGATGTLGPNPTKPIIGTQASEPLPAQVAVVAIYGPGDRQHRQGRNYLPGAVETHSSSGTGLSTVGLTLWQLSLDNFSAGVNSVDLQLGWVSIPAGESPDFRPADTHIIRSRFGTQRRRILL